MADEQNMEEFEKELVHSFQVLHEGDMIEGTIIGISDKEVNIDLNYYTEGFVPLIECSNDPSFSIKNDLNIGDNITLMVLDSEDPSGRVKLSIKGATEILIWDELAEDMKERKIFNVKVWQTVNGGLICYLKGVRAFIPASQIALDYVEDLDSYSGMKLDVVIIDIDKSDHRLVLSAKQLLKEKLVAEKQQKIGRLALGDIISGKVERMEKYGIFISLGNDIQGLCHISEITNKFIKSPKEVVKLGDSVHAKIIKIDGDRISLSMKALIEEKSQPLEEYSVPEEYKASSDDKEESGNNPFAALLKDVKL